MSQDPILHLAMRLDRLDGELRTVRDSLAALRVSTISDVSEIEHVKNLTLTVDRSVKSAYDMVKALEKRVEALEPTPPPAIKWHDLLTPASEPKLERPVRMAWSPDRSRWAIDTGSVSIELWENGVRRSTVASIFRAEEWLRGER